MPAPRPTDDGLTGLHAQADALQGQRRFDDAAQAFVALAQRDPARADAWRRAADCLFALDRHRDARSEVSPTARADWAKVTGTDLDGNEVVLEGHGFFARMLQHETDHLDGYLYLDRLTPTMRLESREAVKDRGWQYDGLTKWDPATTKAEDVGA